PAQILLKPVWRMKIHKPKYLLLYRYGQAGRTLQGQDSTSLFFGVFVFFHKRYLLRFGESYEMGCPQVCEGTTFPSPACANVPWNRSAVFLPRASLSTPVPPLQVRIPPCRSGKPPGARAHPPREFWPGSVPATVWGASRLARCG